MSEKSTSNIVEESTTNNQKNTNNTKENINVESKTTTKVKENISIENTNNVTINNTKEGINMENKTTTKTKENTENKTTKEEFTPVFKIEVELNSYNEAMDISKPMSYEEGGKWQYSLFTIIKDVLNNENQETFNKEWNTILNFFDKNKQGIFNENYVYRFLENWPGSQTELTLFRRVIYLLLETATHTTRKKALENINLEKLFDGISESSRNRILSFYGL